MRLQLGEGGGSLAAQLLRVRPKSALLTGFDDAEIASLASALDVIPVKDGQRVMLRGQRALWVGVLLQGKVRISHHGKEVQTLGPGDGLGEAALLRDGFRTADGISDGDGTIAVLMLDSFHNLPVDLALKLHGACTHSALGKQRTALGHAGAQEGDGGTLVQQLQAQLSGGTGMLAAGGFSKSEVLLMAQHMHFSRFAKGDVIRAPGILLAGDLNMGGAGAGSWSAKAGEGFGELLPRSAAITGNGGGFGEGTAHSAVVRSEQATVALLPYTELSELGKRTFT
ncbi:hypothetical protein T492DRAFT_363676 [Pavlovales sp. CCMP2436]|nr:hypothetical protein T492DRAFT_363676 [Pavlovales sp. CCMP2436]